MNLDLVKMSFTATKDKQPASLTTSSLFQRLDLKFAEIKSKTNLDRRIVFSYSVFGRNIRSQIKMMMPICNRNSIDKLWSLWLSFLRSQHGVVRELERNLK